MSLQDLNPIASKDAQLQRLNICLQCEYRSSVLGISKCNACGCPIRSKIALKSSECPKHKWGSENTDK